MQFNAFAEGLVTVALAIVGLAIIATLVGQHAQTAAVAQSVGGAFSESLGAAEAPVTGQAVHPSFPSSFGNVDLSSMLST